ncbi:glycine betaine/proline transport system permease protein [Halanaerobium saccharolyticum]|uniref:Glycine betaine/proline transport system permease protein n=1 Tax=Halanaerobium saccharolyticum TaxID=43595 RepID=A0A4R6LCJ9_9FIRM|nr:ABC transporter permease subunit [Halanaerobium saccharolyticum]TDO73366.1 glycine betaine/proline transport system permease protein [Halanaerobium saccharolyticum]
MVIIINSILELLTTKIPLGNWVENLVNFLINNFSGPLNGFASFIEFIVSGIESILAFPHPLILIAIFAAAAWKLKGKKMAVFVTLGLLLVLNLGMWEPLVVTLASIITSVLIALVIGIPIGIIKAHNKVVDLVTRPILDFMQTIPPFVYLIPALMFFGLGNVSGVIATVVFAIAPPIRLTYLGIKQVDEELEEAGHAFGANWWQILFKIELPGAMPSIMMGINQCIMLSLSMVVIAAMIGAGGLGKPVLRSLNVVDIGLGFEAGLGVVIIAMVLDRMFGRDS